MGSFTVGRVPMGNPASQLIRQRVRFASTDDHNPPNQIVPPQTTPAKEAGFLRKSAQVMKTVARKFTSWKRFKTSVSNGYKAGKADLMETLHSGKPGKIAKRIGLELVGLTLIVVLLPVPLPIPNPGYFISPTGRKFLLTFLKETDDLEKPATEQTLKPDAPPLSEQPKKQSGKTDSENQ